MAYSGKDNTLVKSVKSNITSVKISKLNKKKINQKKDVKCCVVAYKMVDGKKVVLAKSLDIKAIGAKNKKKSDVKSISLTKKIPSLKKKKSATLKFETVLKNGKKVFGKNSSFKYASSNKKVATVNKKGKITAKDKGTCYIWIYATNGCSKKVKITVK